MPARTKLTRRAFLKRATLGALAVGGPSGFSSTHWLSVEHTPLTLPTWQAPSFKLAFLSDLHIDKQADLALTQRAIQAAIDFRPQVILFGGDYLTDNPPEKLSMLRQALLPLKHALCPVYGILGNHDYYRGQLARTLEALAQCGVKVLQNEETTVDGVRFIGFDDGNCSVPAFRKFLPDGSPTIVLLHEPDLVRESPTWAQLQLSGHSHGGQICLPGGIPLMGTQEAEKYIRGIYPDASIPLYVSRGLGTRRVPFRYYCRPEVTLLTISG